MLQVFNQHFKMHGTKTLDLHARNDLPALSSDSVDFFCCSFQDLHSSTGNVDLGSVDGEAACDGWDKEEISSSLKLGLRCA